MAPHDPAPLNTVVSGGIADIEQKQTDPYYEVSIETDAGRDIAPGIERLFADIRHGLPEFYFLDEDRRVIIDTSIPQRICGPIRVVSYPRRKNGSGWSVEVEFLDRDDHLRRHCFPQVALNSDRGKHVSQLIDKGLAVYADSTGVTEMLQSWAKMPHSWRVEQAGWFCDPEGVASFVRPDGYVHQPVIEGLASVVHACPAAEHSSCAGSLSGWQKEVALAAIGNPPLIFAISAALAGPLLFWSGIDTAGFNLCGPSGVGKSLMLRLALSCGTSPSCLFPWSAAQTGLHRLSAESQDGLLALDAFPRDPDARHLKALLAIGDDAASGRVLPDHDPDGGDRWRRVLLSTSELPLSDTLRRKKKDVPSAFAARIVDIGPVAGAHGLLTELHGARTTREFARRLERGMRNHHGHLLRSFLDRLLVELPQIHESLDNRLSEIADDIEAVSPACAGAIAERLALVSYAGELAIRFNLLPWPKGTASAAARQMAGMVAHSADDCLQDDGAGALPWLRGYVTRHASRIMDLPADRPGEDLPSIIGWRDEEHIYLRGDSIEQDLENPDLFWNALLEQDVLKPGGEQRSRQFKLSGRQVQGRPRCYRLDRNKIERHRACR